MANSVEKLTSLLFATLITSSPVLSGNMKTLIQIDSYSDDECKIVINAPFYDMKRWRKDGVVVHTGQIIHDRTDYAEWVNRLGGFATGNESMHWVNRACVEVAKIIASEIGATVINELEL